MLVSLPVWLVGIIIVTTAFSTSIAVADTNVPTTGKFLLFSDAHYDPYYGTELAFQHSVVDSNKVPPCRMNDAPEWSAYGCGSSKALVRLAVASAARALSSPDFVLFTGDATRHGTLQVPNTSETVKLSMSLIPQLMHEYFPNTPVLSLPPLDLGNNDFAGGDYTLNVTSVQPCNTIVNPNGTRTFPNATSKWLKSVSTQFNSSFATQQEAATFACGGYMVRHMPHQNLSVIVLNTVVWSRYLSTDAYSDELESNDFDPFGQHSWLNATLSELQRAGRKAYITGHIPPILQSFRRALGQSLVYPQHAKRYHDTMAHYQSVVAGQFFGHVHSNELRACLNHPHNNSSSSGPPMVISGSISPCYQSTPFFSIVDHDPDTQVPTDLVTYNVHLDNVNNNNNATFQPMFDSLVAYFGMDNLTNSEVARLASRLVMEEDLWNKYFNTWLQGRPLAECPGPCRLEQACIIQCGTDPELYQACLDNGNACSLSENVYALAKGQSGGSRPPILVWIGVAAVVVILVGFIVYKGVLTSCHRRRSGRMPVPDVDMAVAAAGKSNSEKEMNKGHSIPAIT